MTIQPLVSINGRIDGALSPFERGLAYGDGLFETCRLRAGQVPLWPLHRSRLARACERLKIPCDTVWVQACVDALLVQAATSGVSDGTVKIILTRGPGGRGYRLPEQVEPTLCILVYPTTPGAESAEPEAITTYLCHQRLSVSPALAGLKHLNRLEHVLARAEWEGNAYGEGLLLDLDERLVEATVSNVFAVRAGRLVTPVLDRNGVAGVMRELILTRLAPELQLPVSEAPLRLEALAQADEVLVCNSSYGIKAVVALDADDQGLGRYHWPVGPVTRALAQALVPLWAQGVPEADYLAPSAL
ncbi:aminodeoxychorismate lyase [Marinimicrobium alkaliphilum]|uniref:aminodeoxychorismate lyase n=1 Tax=Marinimicrobium alkaliphilum TaxID=2202654 RepID=UPI000DB956EB|nr:aminodeoxychorismate lyase [Marinimicrobium alkaliphilum]